MDAKDSAQLQTQLQAAYRDLQNNRAQASLEQLEQILTLWPNSSDAIHLQGLSYKALGEIDRARDAFLRCLEMNPSQPEVLNNLANLYKSQKQYSEAESCYLNALKLNPDYLQAWVNLAICYQANGDFPRAIAHLKKALTLSKDNLSALTGLADCHRVLEEYEAAQALYEKVVSLNPQSLNGWHNFGLNYHQQGQQQKALECYAKAYTLAPGRPEVTQSLALCWNELGEVGQAINLFENALHLHPGAIELHQRYNEMLWESEFAHKFGDSYEKAIARTQDKKPLVMGYASLLFRAGQTEQAHLTLQQLLPDHEDDYRVLGLIGEINAELGNYDRAYGCLSDSLTRHFDIDIARQMVKIDLLLARYETAQTLLNEMFTVRPNCQLNWAFQSLVWRLTGDDRYHWLIDYDRFVRSFRLETPAGFESLDAFLDVLEPALLAMHRNERAPLMQTLRNGTQTAPRLLHNPDPAIQLLKQALEKIVHTYIKELPNDHTHPLLSRKRDDFEFSGSWSVKLKPNGFHINHVHTDGWISSSCYISIPKSMKSSPVNTANIDVSTNMPGWIKFGESPLQLGERERIAKCVQPERGMVVLFPSYCWHGTYPFSGNETDFRLTAPFDVIPS